MIKSALLIGLVTVFIATFMLFFIFHSLENLMEGCKGENPHPVCAHLSPFAFSMLVVLLLIGGFILMISFTAYILLSA